MLSAVIIDDEEAAIYLLLDLISRNSSVEVKIAGTACNLKDGVELIKRTQPDIVFLDINMPGRNGLEIFSEFKTPLFKIIFCTAYQQYAIDVLNKYACGYLLKPVDIFDLQGTLQNFSDELVKEQKQLLFEDTINVLCSPDMTGKNIVLDVENGFIIGNTRNIQYCYAKNSYSVVVTYTQKEFFVTKSLKELQELLPDKQFYRTHKSFLVNIYYIRKYVHGKESYVLLDNEIKIPVSVRVTSAIERDIKQKFIV